MGIPKIITWLIIRECLIRTLIVLLAVLSLFIVFDVLDSAKGAVMQQNGFTTLLLRIFFDLPARIYELMPLAVLMGSIWALSLLARNSELTIILISGYTVNQLIMLLLAFGIVIGVLSMFNDEVLDKWSQQVKKNTALMNKNQPHTARKENIWLRYGHMLIHVDRLHNDTITDLVIVEVDDSFTRIKSMIKAKSAFYDNQQWTLENGVQYIFPHVSNPIFLGPDSTVRSNTLPDFEWIDPIHAPLEPATQKRVVHFSKHIWADSPAPRYFIRQDQYTHQLKLRELIPIYQFNRENALRSENLEVFMWRKLFYPLVLAIMSIIGIPFCLKSARQMQTNTRLFIGILIGIAFFVIQSIFANLGIISLPPIVGVLLPLLVFILLTLTAIWWIQRH